MAKEKDTIPYRVKVRGSLQEDVIGKFEALKKVAESLQKPGDTVEIKRLE